MPTNVEMLERYAMLYEQKQAIEEEMADIKRELEDAVSPESDGITTESGWIAHWRDKSGNSWVDVISFAKHRESEMHIAELARMGLVSVPVTKLRQQKGKSAAADAAMRYVVPGGVTEEFRVERA